MNTPFKTALLLFASLLIVAVTTAQANAVAFAKVNTVSLPSIPDTTADQRLALLLFNDSAHTAPGYINDFENIYSDEQKKYLLFFMNEFEKETGVPVYIMTVDTTTIRREEFTRETFDFICLECMSRGNKQKGVFIGISAGFGMMMIRNLNLGRSLDENECRKIINKGFLPYFKKGSFFEGTFSGLKYLQSRIASR